MFKAQILARQLAAKALAKSTRLQPSTEYDSDEDTEGGTFEHKQRMAEMLKTLSRLAKNEKSSKIAEFAPNVV